MKSTVLYSGQQIKIPEKVMLNGEELSPEEAKKVIIPEPEKPKTVVPSKKYYNVRRGDTGSKIAQRYNLTQNQLSRLNPKVNLDKIYVGQKLRVK